MKRLLPLLALLCVFVPSLWGGEGPVSPSLRWEGYKGKAVAAPKVSAVKGPEGLDGVRIEAVADGVYQGALGTFAAPVDLSRFGALEFFILQNMGGPKGENLSGVPGGTISAVSVAILVVSLLVGLFAPSETIVANGDVVTDTTAIALADHFICSIYVLSIVALVAMFFNMTGIMKRK